MYEDTITLRTFKPGWARYINECIAGQATVQGLPTQAITYSSLMPTDSAAWKRLIEEWIQQRRVSGNKPDFTTCSERLLNTASMIVVCKIYKEALSKESGALVIDGFGGITLSEPWHNHMLDTERNSGYLMVDYLMSLPEFVLIHELTHTEIGGELYDIPESLAYGWANIGMVPSLWNADSVAYIVAAMFMYHNGLRIDKQTGSTSFGAVPQNFYQANPGGA